MARIRTIKPEFWAHEELSALPEPVHILAAALLNYADDEGYFNANTQLIKAVCFPIREPSCTIPVGVRYLSGIGYIRVGLGDDGKYYGHIIKFKDHQVINKPKKSKISVKTIDWEVVPDEYRTSTVSVPDEYRQEGKGMERKGMEEIPTTTEIVLADRSISEKSMRNCFEMYYSKLESLYPHANLPAEMETCIAHYAKHPVLDPYPVILKWMNRVKKERSLSLVSKQSEREQILADNAESCRQFAGGV